MKSPFLALVLARWYTRKDGISKHDIKEMANSMKQRGIRHGLLINLNSEDKEERRAAQAESRIGNRHIRRLARSNLSLYQDSVPTWISIVPFAYHNRIETDVTRLVRRFMDVYSSLVELIPSSNPDYNEMKRIFNHIKESFNESYDREPDRFLIPGIMSVVQLELNEIHGILAKARSQGFQQSSKERLHFEIKNIAKKLQVIVRSEGDTLEDQIIADLQHIISHFLLNSHIVKEGILSTIVFKSKMFSLRYRRLFEILQSLSIFVGGFLVLVALGVVFGQAWLHYNTFVPTWLSLIYTFLHGGNREYKSRKGK